MKKMPIPVWKQIAVFPLLCMLLLSCAAPTGFALETVPVDELHEAEHALVSDWFTYLQIEERTARDILWVLGSAKTAVVTSDWEQLQRCLAVLETAALYIRLHELSEEETTDEQYELLSKVYGEDVAVVRMELQGLGKGALAELELLRNDLMLRFFMNATHKNQFDELCNIEEQYKAMLEYDAFSTAYLVKLIEPSEYSQKLQGYVDEYLPLMSSYMPYETFSVEELEALCELTLDNYEESICETKRQKAFRENDIILLSDSVNRDDFSRFSRDSAVITGIGTALPAPPWYYSEEIQFLWELPDSDGLRIPGEAEELTETPCYLYIFCKDVVKGELMSYLERLDSLGYSVMYEKDADVSRYSVESDDWSMTIEWNGVTFAQRFWGRIPCLTPEWYVTP